jgi:hypothetical protein
MVAEDLAELVGIGSGKVGMVAWKEAKKQLKELTEEQKAARRAHRARQYAANKRKRAEAKERKALLRQEQKDDEAEAAKAANRPPSEAALRRKRRNERAAVEAAKTKEQRALARAEADERKAEASAARAVHERKQLEVVKAKAAMEEAELHARASSVRLATDQLGRGEEEAAMAMAAVKKGLGEEVEGKAEAEARKTKVRLGREAAERMRQEAAERVRQAIEEEAAAKTAAEARAKEAKRAEERERAQEERRRIEAEEAEEKRKKEAIEKGDIWDDEDEEDESEDESDDDADGDLFWGPIGGGADAAGGNIADSTLQEASSTAGGSGATSDDEGGDSDGDGAVGTGFGTGGFDWVRPARATSIRQKPRKPGTMTAAVERVEFEEGGLTVIDDDDGLFQHERDQHAAQQPSQWLQPLPSQPLPSQPHPTQATKAGTKQPVSKQPVSKPPTRQVRQPPPPKTSNERRSGKGRGSGSGSGGSTPPSHPSRAVAINSVSAEGATLVLDGANIGYNYGRWSNPHQKKTASLKRCFGARGLEIALRYYNGDDTGASHAGTKHRAVAFLPQRFIESRYQDNLADDVPLLLELNRQGMLFITPSGADDDRFIIKYVQTRSNPCVIVTNDNMADHIASASPTERDSIRDLVCRRTIKYMFVGDEFLPLK